MQRITHKNNVITYTFDSLRGLSVHAHVSTRHGGVSPAPWNSLNFSVRRGDTPERVEQNRGLLAQGVGIDPRTIVTCSMIHGTGIAKVDADDAGTRQSDCDGLITDAVGLPLMLTFADCTPLVFYDPRHHVLGVSHAGWRGTLNGMSLATLWAMQAAYDSNPADMRVGIGPSIGPASYQVGREVLDMARAKLPHADDLFHWPDGPDANPHFDLWQANARGLIDAGVPPQQIEIAGIDTAQNTGDFFSHRAEQGRCGLFVAIAWLAESRDGL
ncbi:MAG: peptidoglycan editing factor PgeF [Caldilineaceae bacterium]|nr:peptidoglycan editing factor PgeF [Caldilineaceae bacterium]